LPKSKKKTSKSEKKNLTPSRIPRISTRGFYDLGSGRKLKNKPCDLYPKRFFETLDQIPEITIMIHGLRNNKFGALTKFSIAQNRLLQLGYKYPVVGFSYDSNTRGVQYKSREKKATSVGRIIARKNAYNLSQFIIDIMKKFPRLKIRLMGHSLGSEVIIHTLAKLQNKTEMVESVYFFGASIPADSVTPKKFGKILQKTVKQKIINYYSPHDEVLKYAFCSDLIEKPLGYQGVSGKTVPKYMQKKVMPKNHRFVSYAAVLESFP
jgi:pimeloyl-ACP methyl ester carboxylesterase